MLFQQQPDTLTVWAPAKLNLYLQVLARRTDGFHELESLMVSIGLYDTLRISSAPAGTIQFHCRSTRSNPETDAAPIPEDRRNLVVRAAELLQTRTGTTAGATLELIKRIPAEAGLGGGSSDAAATLVGLNRFWQLGLTAEALHEMAAELGSDVPFFLVPGGAAICRGRGERIETCRLGRVLTFVVVRPSKGLSTAAVFRRCQPGAAPHPVGQLVTALQTGRLSVAAPLLHNTLQPPAAELNPQIVELQQLFSRLPVLGHAMSGSGSSYFGLCRQRRDAGRIAARLRAAGYRQVFVAQHRIEAA